MGETAMTFIPREKLNTIEDLFNQDGLPAFLAEGTPEDFRFSNDSEKLPEIILKFVFENKKEEAVYRLLNRHKKKISEILDNKSFWIRPTTFHYFLSSALLPEVCPDFGSYYFSPMTNPLEVSTEGDLKILKVEAKLVLITKGNVTNPSEVYEKLKEVLNSFNAGSRYIKISKLEVATQESPFSSGKANLNYEQLSLWT